MAQNLILVAATITALTVILGAFWRYLVKPLWHGLQELKSILQFIAAELRPNGGSTIRDAVNRMESGIRSANTKIDLVGARQLARHNLEDTGIWETDTNGHFKYVNPAMSRLAGALPADFMGLGWKTLVHPMNRAELGTSWKSAVEDRRDFDFEFRFVNGVEVRVSGERMFGPNGELIGWIGDCKRI